MSDAKTLTLLGTNHVSSKSVKKIKEVFAELKPDFICVELDRQRLEGLLNPVKPKLSLSLLPKIGLFGFLFLLVGRYVQKKFGKIANLEPGADMITAVHLAKDNKLQLGLIDRPIEQTLKLLSKQFTFTEKRRLLYDMTLGLFFGKKQKITINLQDIPEDQMMEQLFVSVKERYPTFYAVLLDSRNQFMAKKLLFLQHKFPDKKILAIVGAGHLKGIEEYLRLYTKKTALFKENNSTGN